MSDKSIPAFPVQSIYIEDEPTNSRGMTLRDYFAAKAMQGFAACPDVSWPHTAEMAGLSYKLADAMLKARDEK